MQEELFWMCGAALVLAAVAGFADYRRGKRSNLDAAGFMPWTHIQILSLLAAALCAAFALKAG